MFNITEKLPDLLLFRVYKKNYNCVISLFIFKIIQFSVNILTMLGKMSKNFMNVLVPTILQITPDVARPKLVANLNT